MKNNSKNSLDIKAAKSKTSDLMAFCSTGALEITAEAPAADGAKAKPATFRMNAYNGGAMDLEGWSYPVVIDLAGMSGLDRKRPAFLNHDPKQIVGHITGTSNSGTSLDASGIVSGSGPAAKEVRDSHANGFPWQASVGARATNTEFVKSGSSAQANGRTFNGPVIIARKSVLGEISFVPLGADDTTSAHIAAKAVKDDPMTFEQWLAARGLKLADLNDTLKATLEAAYKADMKAAGTGDDAGNNSSSDLEKDKSKSKKKIAAKAKTAPSDDGDDDIENDDEDPIVAHRKALASENKRVGAIGKIAASYPNIDVTKRAEMQAKAIEEGWDTDKTELEFMRADRPQSGPSIHIKGSHGVSTHATLTAAALTAAVCMTAGLGEKSAMNGLKDPEKEIAASRQLRGFGLAALVHEQLRAAGQYAQAGRIDNDIIRAAIQSDPALNMQANNGFSTISLSGILSNVANKFLLDAYESVPSAVPMIAFETDTNDFKQFTRYRLTGSGQFEEVGPDGELKSMSLSDETFTNQITTKGVKIALTRVMIINDDLGAFTQLPQIVGRQAGISREKAVFKKILAGVGSFWAAGNANYISGSGSALSVDGLNAAVKAFREQKDSNSDPILLNPDRVLVPPALEGTAKQLYTSSTLVGTTTSNKLMASDNPHSGTFKPIVSPYLAASTGLANASDTAFALLPNPSAGAAVVQVGYYRGQRTPTIDQAQAEAGFLGLLWQAFFDYGVAAHDKRCGVWSAGA